MTNNKKKPRKCVRYQRNDIEIYVYNGRAGYVHIKLVNIGQQGVAFRSCLPLKEHKNVIFKIIFDSQHAFKLTGKIVRKVKIQADKQPQEKKSWLSCFCADRSEHEYGVLFDNVSPEFKTFLLQTNLEKRIAHNNL